MTDDKLYYHETPKYGTCEHEWSDPPPDWPRDQDYVPTCNKCGMSFIAHIFAEMP